MITLLVLFLLTVSVSAACSIFEAVLFSATPAFIESVATRSQAGRILKHLKSNIDNSVGAILVVNMFANTVGAAAVGAKFVEVFGEAWQGVAALLMTLSILYLSEIVPKTLGALHWKSFALPCSYVLIFLYYLAYPFVFVSRLSTFFFRKKGSQRMSHDEILALAELAEDSGSLDELETDILEHLMAQKSLFVANIMTPKKLVFALNEDTSIAQALEHSQRHKFSRIPLYSQDGQIRSLVYRQNILRANLAHKGHESLKSIAKEVRQVSASMQVMSLLKLFILRREHLFVVVDEVGFVGVVSLEDAINAVLGVGNLQRH